MECALGPDISGEMIRDMMVHCVERRFDMLRAPHQVQSLSDHGSIFVARRTIEIALALNLAPYFTPVESPENNGMAEAFVKTFKRDYVRVSPSPNAAAALTLIDNWMEDYNTVHPTPGSAIAHLSQPLRVRVNKAPASELPRYCRNLLHLNKHR